ncbi:MAG: hypothetical protein C4341_08940 [Armatimonadota bacterium]
MGLLDVVGVGRGAIIGADLFVVTGVAAGVAGSAMLVGLVIAGAGAKYEYANLVLNPSLGFAAG